MGDSKRSGNKKPETEEEKRKNFLERNRQGKCDHVT
jgi:ATF/CREB family transcription factor